jgi:hypothetical protein
MVIAGGYYIINKLIRREKIRAHVMQSNASNDRKES